MKTLLALATFFLSLTIASEAGAQTFQGTGSNWGSGWTSDSNGGYRGTGSNWGSGWTSDGNGGYRGTGSNWGAGWNFFKGLFR
jgi:hypothetical protein